MKSAPKRATRKKASTRPAGKKKAAGAAKATGATKTSRASNASGAAKSSRGAKAFGVPKAAAKATPKKLGARKPAATARKPAAKKPAAKKPGTRPDFGAPIKGFFSRQPARLRPILEELRTLVQAAAPDATSSIKWGMPFFTLNGTMLCALGSHKSHVNLILSGPPGTYADPEGLLSGDGKMGRNLKLTTLEELPRAAVRGWLRTATALARKG